MALEEQIVAWSLDRPAWQRDVMRRVATGEVFADESYDDLVETILANEPDPGEPFGLAQLPHTEPDDLPVRLLSISKTEHVNALESEQPLTFEPNGLTIIYGDNGSGKSGYARLLKRITRARHQEAEVLSDVFRDTALVMPAAALSIRIGDSEASVNWPDPTRTELKRMLFYDGACGSAYITTESDFPYRPSALFVLDGLIEACVAIRNRIGAKLIENSRATLILPIVSQEVKDTDAGTFLTLLSDRGSQQTLDSLIKTFDESLETIDDLKEQEASLRNSDTSKERQHLSRQSDKLEALHKHLERLYSVLGNDGLSTLQRHRDELRVLEEAATTLANSFETEPLPGVGGSPWKELWESAKRFSEEQAYPGVTFPMSGQGARCVLCQQTLEEESKNRFSRFDLFVKDDIQVRLSVARQEFDAQMGHLSGLAISTEVVADNLKDLEASHRDLVAECRQLLTKFEVAQSQSRDGLAGLGTITQFGIGHSITMSRLIEASKAATTAAANLKNPEVIRERLAALSHRRMELELLREIKGAREIILQEVLRLRQREALEEAKSAASTGPITKKILELSEESITEVVRDTFTRETDRLRLERVTIARTRADRGALLHQPKLVGARQSVTLPRVFSEGERTALGLAAFFTEAHLDASNSALILDDPVTSLDHIRRDLVASKLAALGEHHQTIVFTHDVSFVADLKREARARGVPVAERSVTRSRADERKPGACSTGHPWKAKEVAARLDELRGELARIKRECANWDEKTYEGTVGIWAGNLSETWERIFSQEIVGPVLAEGGLEVRPNMVKVLALFSDADYREFDASYSRASQWAKRHDKSTKINYVAPELSALAEELTLVDAWFKRVKAYRNG